MKFKSPHNDQEIRDTYKKEYLIDLLDYTKPKTSYF